MPKMKTKRSAVKRFKLTGTGKIRRRKAYRGHNNGKMASSRMRRLGQPTLVSKADEANVRQMISS